MNISTYHRRQMRAAFWAAIGNAVLAIGCFFIAALTAGIIRIADPSGGEFWVGLIVLAGFAYGCGRSAYASWTEICKLE